MLLVAYSFACAVRLCSMHVTGCLCSVPVIACLCIVPVSHWLWPVHVTELLVLCAND